MLHAELAAQARLVHVIGTTGLEREQLERLAAAARHAVIVRAGNMSVGVNLLTVLARRVAAVLGPEYDIEIVEMHHRAQGRRALGHGADARRGGGGRAAGQPRRRRRARAATASPGARARGRSASPACAAATWSASTRSSSPGRASGWRCGTSPPTGCSSPAARSARRSGARTQGPGQYGMIDVLGLRDPRRRRSPTAERALFLRRNRRNSAVGRVTAGILAGRTLGAGSTLPEPPHAAGGR